MAEIITGPIKNHTQRLTLGDIREIVESYVHTNGGPEAFGGVDLVVVAPADDNQALTKAVREWRDGPGKQDEFNQFVKGGMVWFGLKHGKGA